MFRKTWLFTLTVAILLSTLILGACTKSDSDAIKDVARSFINAWNRQDLDRCMELYSSDAGYTSADREEMRDAREESGKFNIKNMEEPIITGSTATIWVELESANIGSHSVEIPLVKEDGDWKLAE